MIHFIMKLFFRNFPLVPFLLFLSFIFFSWRKSRAKHYSYFFWFPLPIVLPQLVSVSPLSTPWVLATYSLPEKVISSENYIFFFWLYPKTDLDFFFFKPVVYCELVLKPLAPMWNYSSTVSPGLSQDRLDQQFRMALDTDCNHEREMQRARKTRE